MVWVALAPFLDDLKQAVVGMLVGADCLPVLERGMVATYPDLEEKHTTICSATLLDGLGFTGSSARKIHTPNCCFVLELLKVLSPVTMSQTQRDCPPSNFFIIRVLCLTLPLFCSSTKLWGTQWVQRLKTLRWLWRSLFTLPVHLVSLCYSWVFPDHQLHFNDIFCRNDLPGDHNGRNDLLGDRNGCRLPVSVVQTEILSTTGSQWIYQIFLKKMYVQTKKKKHSP